LPPRVGVPGRQPLSYTPIRGPLILVAACRRYCCVCGCRPFQAACEPDARSYVAL